MVKEIADVYEVIDCIIETFGLDKDKIISYQALKKAERGSFTKNSFVETFSPKKDSSEERYCLLNVHRAPEIF